MTLLLGRRLLPHHVVRFVLGAALTVFFIDAFLLGAPWHAIVLLSLLGLASFWGLWVAVEHGALAPIHWGDVLCSGLSTFLVLILLHSGMHSVVLAAGLIGSLAGWLELRFPQGVFLGVAPACYCGVFVGMTSESVLINPLFIVLAGGLAGGFWSLLRHSWIGIGGKMGPMAFFAVFVAIGLAIVFGRAAPGVRPNALPSLETPMILVASVLSPFLTHWLAYRRQWGVVLGSALPSASVALILLFLIHPFYDFSGRVEAAWMGASFVGMTNLNTRELPAWTLGVMGLCFGLLTLCFEPSLVGVGGDLGVTAAVSAASAKAESGARGEGSIRCGC
jgi:hypothetical protein